jgi:hypothetical protein
VPSPRETQQRSGDRAGALKFVECELAGKDSVRDQLNTSDASANERSDASEARRE